MEQFRRSGLVDVMSVPLDPWAPGAVFEYRLTSRRRTCVRRLNAWRLMKMFLPDALRRPPDYVISDAAAQRFDRVMSQRRQTTWHVGLVFGSGPTTRRVC